MHMYFGRWSGLFGNSEPYTLIFHDSKFSVEIHLYVCIYIYFDTDLLYKEFITN